MRIQKRRLRLLCLLAVLAGSAACSTTTQLTNSSATFSKDEISQKDDTDVLYFVEKFDDQTKQRKKLRFCNVFYTITANLVRLNNYTQILE